MQINESQGRRTEQGSALVYILIAIALLAALTFTFMEPSSQQTSSQNTFKSATALTGQIDMIRSAVHECVLSYPKGDKTIDTTTGTGTDPDARDNWPINPDSDHYLTATPGKSGDMLVQNIRCPGDNPGGANKEDHALIFSGTSGKFMPPAPDLFDDWQWYNGADGIFFWTETDKTDAFIITALTKIDDKFSECEADIIDTSDAPAGAKDLDNLGDFTCPANNICLRVRMIIKGTPVYNGDADGDEGGC